LIKNNQELLESMTVLEEEEIWIEGVPKKGDHIRVSRHLYTHHGIYISDEEVIHFTGEDDDSILDWSKNKVIRTDLDRFLLGGDLEYKVYTEDELKDLYPVDHIVHYARVCLDDDGYDLIFNNCEHFANVCTLGRFKSHQVERVFRWIFNIPKESGRDMGWFDWIPEIFGGKSSGESSRSSSTSTYTYEPDKVKMAEIEQETKLRLAGLENARIDMIKNARLEVLEREHYLQEALIEANARGLSFVAETIVTMQNKLNEVTEKRVEIIEKGSLGIVRDIEGFYAEMREKISQDNLDYRQTKLPQLLETLNKFEEGSPAFKIFEESINEDKAFHVQSITKQIDSLSKRQDQIIDEFLKTKNHIVDQTSQITAGILEASLRQSQLSLTDSNHREAKRLGLGESSKLGELGD
jgi:hypothetical protein